MAENMETLPVNIVAWIANLTMQVQDNAVKFKWLEEENVAIREENQSL